MHFNPMINQTVQPCEHLPPVEIHELNAIAYNPLLLHSDFPFLFFLSFSLSFLENAIANSG
jgi:hypothetical protein